MGLSFRKTINLGKHVKVNLSKTGVSASVKVGNVTYNTKRGISANLRRRKNNHCEVIKWKK